MVARIAALLFAVGISVSAYAQRLDVALFSAADQSGWEEKSFDGHTRYELRKDGGKVALYATSRAAASGLFREIEVDLQRTPYLRWTWKLEKLVESSDERLKQGDDYSARIYVVFSGGLLFWRTRAINYVWSNHEPVDSAWPNPFTANAQMIAVRSGSEQLGQWLTEGRNVRADYQRLFGGDPGEVVAVALMTDTDNTGSTAAAWYGDIWFTAY